MNSSEHFQDASETPTYIHKNKHFIFPKTKPLDWTHIL